MMISLPVGYREISSSLERLRPGAVAFTALVLSAIAIVGATMLVNRPE